jgi:hypothetical protein
MISRTTSSFGAALSPGGRHRSDDANFDLDALLARYSEHIAKLRQHEALKPILDESEHDDVFLLRHIMSCKGHLARSAQSAEEGIKWRRENVSLLARADELHRTVKETIPVGMLPHASTLDQPIQVVMPFQVNLDRFAKASTDWHFETGIANREVAFRLCDRITRQKRKLIKMILILDLSGLTFSFAYSQYRLNAVQGKLSKVSAVVYPQVRGAQAPTPLHPLSPPPPPPPATTHLCLRTFASPRPAPQCPRDRASQALPDALSRLLQPPPCSPWPAVARPLSLGCARSRMHSSCRQS